MTLTRLTQPTLRMTIAANVALVEPGTVMAALGIDRESVHDSIDNGALPWAWDLAADGSPRREIRVWKQCLDRDAAILAQLETADVIDEILGFKSEHRSGALQQLLTISHQLVLKFVRAGELTGEIRSHTLWIKRPSLVAFLTARRIGA